MVGAHIGLGPLPASQAVKCDRAVEYDPSPLGVSALTQNDLEGVVMQHEPCSLISPQRQLRVPGTACDSLTWGLRGIQHIVQNLRDVLERWLCGKCSLWRRLGKAQQGSGPL